MEKGWFAISAIFFLVATGVTFACASWVMTDVPVAVSAEYGPSAVLGVFIVPIMLYFLSYKAWKKTKS